MCHTNICQQVDSLLFLRVHISSSSSEPCEGKQGASSRRVSAASLMQILDKSTASDA